MHSIIVAVLISQMGAEDFRTRETAHQAIERLGSLAHPHLVIAEKSGCMEVRARARRLLDRWYSDNAEKIVAQYGPLPWISCDVDDGPYTSEAVNAYLDAARIKVGVHGRDSDWKDWRVATQLLITQLVRQRLDPEPLINDLWDAEARWRFQNSYEDLPR